MHRRILLTSALIYGASGLGLPGPNLAHAVNEPPVRARLGIYQGAGCDGRAALAGFTAWLGRRPEWIVDFLAQESWQSFHQSAVWIAGCWRGDDAHLSIAVPMLTQNPHDSLDNGAAGTYDDHFKQLARTLVSTGRAAAVIRLGWEFNGDWSTWCPARDPEAFVRYWRRIVRAMRATPDARFRFDWNISLGRAAIPAEEVYPGDDVVDIIGLDVYNQSWTIPRPDNEARWQELRHQPYGLDWHRSFAEARGKPRSFPEWGTGRRPDGSGGGDDPMFVDQMALWVDAPDVIYHGYWDYPAADYNARLSNGQFPRAAAMFQERFGQIAPRR